jgi:hypothetical protein
MADKNEPIKPELYRLIFEESPQGAQILEDLVARFGGNPFVKGGLEGDRQTCFNAGRNEVVQFILRRINQANGVQDV